MIGKHFKFVLTALFAAGFSAANSTAVSIYQDIDEFDHLNTLNKNNPRANGIFDIVIGDGDSITIDYDYADDGIEYHDMAGFDPNTEEVISAAAYFYFDDDIDHKGRKEVVEVSLGSINNFVGPYEVDINNILGGGSAQLIVELNLDGIVEYSITRTQGDFYFDYARLVAKARPETSNKTVPDAGSTLLLSGFALAGLSAMRRTFGAPIT